MVKNKECAFCHMEKPIKPLISDNPSVDGEDYTLSPAKSRFTSWLETMPVAICYPIIAEFR